MATTSAIQAPSVVEMSGKKAALREARAGGMAANATGHSLRRPLRIAPSSHPPCTLATVIAYTWASQNTMPLTTSSTDSPIAGIGPALTITVPATTEPYTADVKSVPSRRDGTSGRGPVGPRAEVISASGAGAPVLAGG